MVEFESSIEFFKTDMPQCDAGHCSTAGEYWRDVGQYLPTDDTCFDVGQCLATGDLRIAAYLHINPLRSEKSKLKN